jgi:hypothetical protein
MCPANPTEPTSPVRVRTSIRCPSQRCRFSCRRLSCGAKFRVETQTRPGRAPRRRNVRQRSPPRKCRRTLRQSALSLQRKCEVRAKVQRREGTTASATNRKHTPVGSINRYSGAPVSDEYSGTLLREARHQRGRRPSFLTRSIEWRTDIPMPDTSCRQTCVITARGMHAIVPICCRYAHSQPFLLRVPCCVLDATCTARRMSSRISRRHSGAIALKHSAAVDQTRAVGRSVRVPFLVRCISSRGCAMQRVLHSRVLHSTRRSRRRECHG